MTRFIHVNMRVALAGVFLAACTAAPATATPTPGAPIVASSLTPSGAIAPASAPSGLPSLDPSVETLVLPAEFAATISQVSPDGRFLAARTRDYSRVVLYRITRPSPRAPQLQLTAIAEVAGYADEMAWLEDSSGVLVGTDLDPNTSLAHHDPSGASRRVAVVNPDGHVTIASAEVHSFLFPLPGMSADGHWIWANDGCCAQQISLLSRDGTAVRTVVGPRPRGVGVGFVGWDPDGLLLYWEGDAHRSTLVAVDANGSERYRIAAPSELGSVGWGVVASAPDRSWQLVELGGGIGSSVRVRRILVGRELRMLPPALDHSSYGTFASGNEIVFADDTGAMHAYEPLRGRLRDLPVHLPVAAGVSFAGVAGGYLVWMERIYGRLTDLSTGRTVALKLSSPLNVSTAEGGRLVEYQFDSNAIVFFELALIARQ